MYQDGDFLVIDTELFELEESLWDFDKEIIFVVHLLNYFYNVGYELISDSVMAEHWCNDGYFGCGI